VIAVISYQWRGSVRNPELNALHADGFGHRLLDDDWEAHAFILDTLVATAARRHGIGTRMVTIAAEQARAARCEWLHVDFEEHLRSFYLDSCGFRPTPAGLIAL
jgi:GNAT superfamily N-acetyltransferase